LIGGIFQDEMLKGFPVVNTGFNCGIISFIHFLIDFGCSVGLAGFYEERILPFG
jgi:hypothetical protein